MRVYISGAVTGDPDHSAHFTSMHRQIEARWPYAQIINPVEMIRALPDSLEYKEIMGFCMYALSKCDTICMLDGWEESKGANREYGYALGKDMAIMYEGEV